MQIQVTKDELFLALSKVSPAINFKSTLPILQNILIEASKDEIKLTATDLEIGMSTQVKATISEEGDITVPAKKFISIVRELPNELIEIEVNKSCSVSIKSGSAYFKLMGLNKDDFPKFPKFSINDGVKIKGNILKEAIKLTSFAISTDETRYALNGALMEIKENILKLVATDGRRLALCNKKINCKDDTEMKFIVPAKAMHELNKNIDNDSDITIIDLGNQVIFYFEKFFIISRLIDGHFPNYNQVMPDEISIKVTLNREDFYGALRRVAILTSMESQAVKVDILKNNKMILSSKSPNLGESKEDIELELKQGGEITIGFNPNYITDVLKNLDIEKVILSLSESNKPGIIEGKEGYVYVIMPMQIL